MIKFVHERLDCFHCAQLARCQAKSQTLITETNNNTLLDGFILFAYVVTDIIV